MPRSAEPRENHSTRGRSPSKRQEMVRGNRSDGLLLESDVPVRVLHRRRRTAAIVVRPDTSVEVLVPMRLSRARVLEIVAAKREWILRKRREAAENLLRYKPQSYEDGARILYLGRKITLRIQDSRTGKPLLEGRTLYVKAGRPRSLPAVRRSIMLWYKDRATEILAERTFHYAGILGVKPGPVRVRNMKSRWGSCSAQGALTYNLRLILAPLDVLDYVVVHELCHIREPNHSPAFWALVKAVIPGVDRYKAWLREEGRGLEL